MLGYLLRGDPRRTFALIAAELSQEPMHHPHFLDRPHRMTNHRREEVPQINSPQKFTCHHLLLRIPTADTLLAEE